MIYVFGLTFVENRTLFLKSVLLALAIALGCRSSACAHDLRASWRWAGEGWESAGAATIGLLATPVRHGPLLASAALHPGRQLDKRICVKAVFDDGTMAVGAVVLVKDSDGEVVAEGKLDVKGEWQFAKPNSGKYVIRVDAGGGHVEKMVFSTEQVIPPPTPPTGFPLPQMIIGICAIVIMAIALMIAVWHNRKKREASESQQP